MTVDGEAYSSDLIVFPEKVVANWRRSEGHSLAPGDLREVFSYAPEVLVVGMGASACMRIPQETRRLIADKKIELKDMDTASAWPVFNELAKKGVKVAGAFHLTC